MVSPAHAALATAITTQSVRLTTPNVFTSFKICNGSREQTPRVRVLDTAVTPGAADDLTLPPTGQPAPATHAPTGIVVYWRPGCGFCSRLFRQLERAELAHRRVNIWDDSDGAAIVRSIDRGNETVPTVTVGPYGLVNPSVRDIVAAMTAAGGSPVASPP
jgi:glutaredoxin